MHGTAIPRYNIALKARTVLSEIFMVYLLLESSGNEKRPRVPSGPAASECFGQPIQLNCCLRELHLFPHHIRDHGHSVLNLQLFDLPVPELLAKADQPRPLLRDQLHYFLAILVFTFVTHATESPGATPFLNPVLKC